MTASLVLNRARQALLDAVSRGRVYRSLKHCDMRMERGRMNQRVDRALRELREAGWVELGADGRTYQLTSAGGVVLEGWSR